MRAQAAACIAIACAVSAFIGAQPGTQTAVAFVGVSVIPMDKEAVVANQTVVVRDGKIVSVSARADLPPGAVRIDGTGKFLLPGLAEMHAHIPGGKAPNEAVERTLFLYVANGVTTIRGMLGDPRHLSYRASVVNGAVVGPRIYTSGPSFNGNTAPTPEAAVEAVVAQKKSGYDLLKIHPGVPLDAFEALAAKAHELKMPFAGHVPAAVGLHRALEAGYRSIDHLDGYVEALATGSTPSQFFGVNLMKEVDESRLPALVKATRAAGVWQVPTEVLLVNLLDDMTTDALVARPEMQYASKAEIEAWSGQRAKFQQIPAEERKRFLSIRKRLIKQLHDAGVPFALGSDAPQMWNVPGFSIHRELQSLVDAGLTPYQALRTGTANVGAYFGTQDGVIAAGRRADLLLLDANPLQDIANSSKIAGVMVNGRWLPKSDIEKRLAGGG